MRRSVTITSKASARSSRTAAVTPSASRTRWPRCLSKSARVVRAEDWSSTTRIAAIRPEGSHSVPVPKSGRAGAWEGRAEEAVFQDGTSEFRFELLWQKGRLPVDPVLLQLAPEGRAPDPEGLGRPRVIPARALERLHDEDPLGLGQGLRRFEARRGAERQARGNVGRQGAPVGPGGPGEHGAALHGIFELPDVPGPRVAEEALHGGGAQPQDAALSLREPGQEVLSQERNVLATLAERWQRHRNHVEAIEEIFAEAALVDHLREIAVRGGDDTCVDGDGLCRADGPDLAALERAQELGLQARRHLADLVEQERPAMRFLEQPLLVRGRSREGPLDVAEELRLEERLGERRAVDGDEGAAWALARVVDRLG